MLFRQGCFFDLEVVEILRNHDRSLNVISFLEITLKSSISKETTVTVCRDCSWR